MIVDLLQKFGETLNSDLEIENIQKIKSYQEQCNDLLTDLQELKIDFQVSSADHYSNQIEQFNVKNKMLLDSITQYEKFIGDLKNPIAQLKNHIQNCQNQIDKLKGEIADDPECFDLDIKLFKELGVFSEDDSILVQQDHLKMFKKLSPEENPWEYLYEQ
eukprot:NODE_283_length_10814_cov_0.705460.p10 type:complete len:160 gc:universal NODE_283_length_10814_cov_0.705460:1723-2202(+)